MFNQTIMGIRNAEDSAKQAKENQLTEVMEKIAIAVGRGLFECEYSLTYLQGELLEELGYTVTREDEKSKKYKITW